MKETFEINKGVAFIARRLYPPLLGSIALAQRVLFAMLQAGGVCLNHCWFCQKVSFVACRKDCKHVCGIDKSCPKGGCWWDSRRQGTVKGQRKEGEAAGGRLEINSGVARPRRHGEVVLRCCSAKPHATTIKWSSYLPPPCRCSAGVGLERGSWCLLKPVMGRSSSAKPH